MLRTAGKMMQVAGLVILPVAMLLQLMGGYRAATGSPGITVSVMLIMFVGGAALFYLGRMLEGIGQR
jgi:hypothetical protein